MPGAAFEKMKSLCGGDKADSNNGISNTKNKLKKSIVKKKVLMKKAAEQKKSNIKSQKVSIETLVREENIKNADCKLKIDAVNFKDAINVAVKMSQDKQQVQNMNDEKDSINVERDHSDRVTKLNKYGVSGWMLDK